MFVSGHATHPDWRVALALAAAQLDAQLAGQPAALPATLGWVYLTDHYAPHAAALLADVQQRWPGVDWVGAVGIGVSASGVEYFDEPALSLLLSDMPREGYRVYSGGAPLGTFTADSAQVHVDASTADAAELIEEMSERTASGYLFGGVASARTQAWQIANGLFQGGLSGVAFGPAVRLISRVTQGCQPVGPTRRITRSESNRVARLDDQPALDCLLQDLGLTALDHREALPQLRQTLVGLVDAGDVPDEATPRTGQFGPATRVRHLLGLTPLDRGLAIAEQVETGTQLTFCRRNTEAARRDLVRICSEIREEVEGQDLLPGEPGARIAAAIYISCTGRGGPHFGGPSAELAIVKHALGDVPLTGFFAGGEIAHHHLYGYTGVLTVFVEPV